MSLHPCNMCWRIFLICSVALGNSTVRYVYNISGNSLHSTYLDVYERNRFCGLGRSTGYTISQFRAFRSYGREMHVAHPSKLLCNSFFHNPIASSTHTAVLIFKTARTGSTWLSKLLGMEKNIIRVWEPFGGGRCVHLHAVSFEEDTMMKLLTSRCDKQMRHGKLKTNRCDMAASCHNLKSSVIPAVFLNPRFVDRISWASVVHRVARSVLVLNLRRTNLVSMAYSKFHHGGCDNRSGQFDINVLLACVWDYGIGDQEYATYSALSASTIPPLLVLYEDVNAHAQMLKDRILNLVGLTSEGGKVGIEKEHVAPSLCDYPDVDCATLRPQLRQYPCLSKQLSNKSPVVAWTMPLFADGRIGLGGDCHPLPETVSGVRRYADLYT